MSKNLLFLAPIMLTISSFMAQPLIAQQDPQEKNAQPDAKQLTPEEQAARAKRLEVAKKRRARASAGLAKAKANVEVMRQSKASDQLNGKVRESFVNEIVGVLKRSSVPLRSDEIFDIMFQNSQIVKLALEGSNNPVSMANEMRSLVKIELRNLQGAYPKTLVQNSKGEWTLKK